MEIDLLERGHIRPVSQIWNAWFTWLIETALWFLNKTLHPYCPKYYVYGVDGTLLCIAPQATSFQFVRWYLVSIRTLGGQATYERKRLMRKCMSSNMLFDWFMHHIIAGAGSADPRTFAWDRLRSEWNTPKVRNRNAVSYFPSNACIIASRGTHDQIQVELIHEIVCVNIIQCLQMLQSKRCAMGKLNSSVKKRMHG